MILSQRKLWRLALVSSVMFVILFGLVAVLYLMSAGSQMNDFRYSMAALITENGSTENSLFRSNIQEYVISLNTLCPRHHFFCNSSRECLSLDKRCDGVVDCAGAWDEQQCACAFRMPSSRFCDRYPDCFDESDERYCSYCPDGFFNCGDGHCVPKHRVCDSYVDCENSMDENFCFGLLPNATISVTKHSSRDLSSIIFSHHSGFLLRNKNGIWSPLCVGAGDHMQSALADFACVSITSNPLATSAYQFKKFSSFDHAVHGDFIYHQFGRFVRWRSCIGNSGMWVTCGNARCGLNPLHLLPKRYGGRIVGGAPTTPGAWPWHAAIYKNGTYSCGATLISERLLISAAHCFLQPKQNFFEVQLGMLRRRSLSPHQRTYVIEQIDHHPQFNSVTLEYDIALLRLSEDVHFDFWIRPICLPSAEIVETLDSGSGPMCTAIGWGDQGEEENDSDELLEVHVPLMKTCKRNPDRWLCAGYPDGGKDACQGDSGGPLMCPQVDGLSWYIAGVISGGRGCARPGVPGMYTRVEYFLDWIKESMSAMSGESPLRSCPGWTCVALGGGQCLDPQKVCDGHVDCFDAGDEMSCSTNSYHLDE